MGKEGSRKEVVWQMTVILVVNVFFILHLDDYVIVPHGFGQLGIDPLPHPKG